LSEAQRAGTRALRADATRGWKLLGLSVATSVDGLVVGVPLAALGAPIAVPAVVVGVVVALLTMAGMLVGGHVGKAWGRRAELAGGLGLCAIGAKVLLQHVVGGVTGPGTGRPRSRSSAPPRPATPSRP
jgi:putative Mn2+ efflux pump MntP